GEPEHHLHHGRDLVADAAYLLEHRVDVDHRQVREALHQVCREARLRCRHADRGDVAGREAFERAGRGEHEEVRPEAFPVDAAQAGDAAFETLAGDVEGDV